MGASVGELFLDERQHIRIDLRPAGSVVGRTRDAWSGDPVAGVEVWLHAHGRAHATLTDSEGRFELRGIPASGTSQSIHFLGPFHGVESAWVCIGEDGSWWTRTAGGGFDDELEPPVLLGPRSGEGVRRARPAEPPPELLERRREGATPPAELADVLLVESRSLRGRVVSQDRASLQGARVEARGYYFVRPGMAFPDHLVTVTGADGSFEIAGLRSDAGHVLSVRAEGRGRLEQFVPGGRAGTVDLGTLLLPEDVVLRGRLVDPTGAPFEGVDVEAELTGGGIRSATDTPVSFRDAPYSLAATERVPTDRDGRYELRSLAPGNWQVRVLSLGEELLRFELPLTGPRYVDEVRTVDVAGPALEGLVLSGEEPVPGASIEIRAKGRRRTVTSGEGGRFRALGVPVGSDCEVTATWTAPDGSVRRSSAAGVRAGDDLVLRSGGADRDFVEELPRPPGG